MYWFVSSRDRGYAHIFVFDLADRTIRQVTDGDFDDVSPAWSLDGKWLAFSSSRDHRWRVYVAPAICSENSCGTSARQIVDGDPYGSHPTQPVWSSRGQVAFAVLQRNGLYAVYVSDTALKHASRMTQGLMLDTNLAWSPDGTQIAFTSVSDFNQETYTLDVVTGKLTNRSIDLFYDGSPTWSPDGQYLAFASGRGGDIQVYLLNQRDDSLRKLTSGSRTSNPLWSPDGHWIIVESGRSQSTSLVLLDVLTGQFRQLINAHTNYYGVVWKP
jgi:TolB protein